MSESAVMHELVALKGRSLPRGFPRWARCYGVLGAGEAFFVPAGLAADERMVWLCAAMDRVPGLWHADHFYVESEWLADQYPKCADACRVFRETWESGRNGMAEHCS